MTWVCQECGEKITEKNFWRHKHHRYKEDGRQEPWPVICAHCGKEMPMQSLTIHCRNKHGWKTRTGGSIDPKSNPMWKQGGNIP